MPLNPRTLAPSSSFTPTSIAVRDLLIMPAAALSGICGVTR